MSDLSTELRQLVERAQQASAQGAMSQALQLWRQAASRASEQVPVLAAFGQTLFRCGEHAEARAVFERVCALDGRQVQQWVNLALACQMLKDEAAEADALQRALRTDPTDLLALILRANLLERQGQVHQAARVYSSVLANSPPLDQLHPSLRPAVEQAHRFRDRYEQQLGAYLDAYLSEDYERLRGEKLRRFQRSVDLMVGRQRRYDSQPSNYYMPELAAIEFFDRELFPWLPGLEQATAAIRQEFLGVLAEDQGFMPYLQYPDDVPHFQFAELNRSPRWSAFHLWKDGEMQAENAAKCPQTLDALSRCEQPRQLGRTPNAMFSLLKPGTRIPPHVGVSNARLITHLPLIVPPGCGFRVGGSTRGWVPGEAFVFDDTIEHEAWNDSAELRVVLIFDTWHPHLTPPERELVAKLSQGLQAFASGDTFAL